MDHKSKIRLTISAVTCSLILGGASIALKNLHSDNFTIPFYRDSLKTYKVCSKELTIDELGSKQVVESDTTEDYLLLSEMETKDSLRVSISSPVTLEKRRKNFYKETDDIYVSHCYEGSFSYESLTDEEIDEKIKLFKDENLKELVQGVNYSFTYKDTYNNLDDCKNKDGVYSASLKVNTIDLDDIKFEKQSIDKNVAETLLFSLSTFLGAYAGISIGNDLNKRIKRKVKTGEIQH